MDNPPGAAMRGVTGMPRTHVKRVRLAHSFVDRFMDVLDFRDDRRRKVSSLFILMRDFQ